MSGILQAMPPMRHIDGDPLLPCLSQVLKQAVEMFPIQGFEKYMYLGQLLEDEEAIGYTRMGVQILQTALNAGPNMGASEEDREVGLCKC